MRSGVLSLQAPKVQMKSICSGMNSVSLTDTESFISTTLVTGVEQLERAGCHSASCRQGHGFGNRFHGMAKTLVVSAEDGIGRTRFE